MSVADPARTEPERLEEILGVLLGLARLDFTARARVTGAGPLDALAASANMLAEELDHALRTLSAAKAEAESATLAKSAFLAHMSHEIRTPLTALLGFADLLAAPALSESDRLNYAMIIQRNGEHLLEVINDLLDLSKIEAGKLAVERRDCSPVGLLAEVAALMRIRAEQRGLRFEVVLATPVPATISTDPTRLRQVLHNLVGNAVKFTSQGSVILTASSSADGRTMTLAVADTGIGMSPEQLGQLFRPFQQADVTMSRRFGGTGLGLAICRPMVEALGGALTVESRLGQGSTFVVRLPVEAAAGTPLVSAIPAESGASEGSKRGEAALLSGAVLLAEDGPDNQVLIATLLRRAGLTVAVVASGDLAVEGALAAGREGRPFDLVLMDMQMPVLDGYEATRSLRAAGYGGPVVALTAHTMSGERERCLAAGCDGYLAKPLDPVEFRALLRRFLRQRPPPDTAPERIYSRFHADPDLGPIIPLFVDTLPERAERMRAAWRAGEARELARLAHQLRGAAGGYGFPGITAAAAEVEDALDGHREGVMVDRLLGELLGLCGRANAGSPRQGA
jgi:signal transduction histidine kinase/CheY-like chemotaxis protein/HPt (histidine-containing phosphotransfer) domain-containing protein